MEDQKIRIITKSTASVLVQKLTIVQCLLIATVSHQKVVEGTHQTLKVRLDWMDH